MSVVYLLLRIYLKADEHSHAASHVEIAFRDEYLARGDMWHLVISELNGKATYKGQKLLFMGSIKAVVKAIYLRGKSVKSAVFTSTTKPIFRSESARYVLFIQMSKEMWDFDIEGSGEIMFSKVVSGFLPELFKRWAKMNARHLVSIILFTRLEYDGKAEAGDTNVKTAQSELRFREAQKEVRDYYRVVVTEMSSGDWVNILYQLKREFKVFLRDVSVTETPATDRSSVLSPEGNGNSGPGHIIAGHPSASPRSNILEAINLASYQFARDYIDRDLVRTGISVVIISPGTGVYEVDYHMLKLTTDVLVSNGIGIDLVCLSRMPLHSVPLFKYRNPAVESLLTSEMASSRISSDVISRKASSHFSAVGTAPMTSPSFHSGQPSSPGHPQTKVPPILESDWSFAMPHWIDISFWTGPSDRSSIQGGLSNTTQRYAGQRRDHGHSFALRCRMYELQMMGVMQNEMSDISISPIHDDIFNSHQYGITENRKLRSHTSSEKSVADSGQEHRNSWTELKSPGSGGTYKTKALERMEDYDDKVFRYSHQPDLPRKDLERLHGDKLTTGADETPYLGTSMGSKARSPSEFEYAARSGYFDRKMKDRAREQRESPRGNGFASSSVYGIQDASQKLRKPIRQISFGSGGFKTPKAMASTEISGHIGPAPALTRGFNPDPFLDKEAFAVSHRVRSSLNRKTSQQIATPISTARLNAPSAERPSLPIAIKSTSRMQDGHPYNTEHEANAGNFGNANNESRKMDVLRAASIHKQAGPKIHLSSSSGATEVPSTLSPAGALSPWLTLLNPSNPRKNDLNLGSHFRRWQHVFPRQNRKSAMKWKSLCSPAAVPLTNEYFPSAEQLSTEYHESPYKITQNEDEDHIDFPRSREALMRELISFRLSHGFQIVVGRVLEGLSANAIDVFGKNYMSHDGAIMFMTAGNNIHQLQCITGGEVEVKRYSRKPTTALVRSIETDRPITYRPYIRTLFEKTYEGHEMVFHPPVEEYNWNFIDNFLAGYQEDFSESLRFWRARFVLIPVEQTSITRRALPTVTEDSEEEIRLEGIRQLTQLWQKHRCMSAEEQPLQTSTRKRKDTNPLAVEYQTRDPSAVVAAAVTSGADGSPLVEGHHTGVAQAISESEPYHTQHYDIQKLAQDLQGDTGVRMLDRRWHLRLHYNCFLGSDLTSWLLQSFTDIETREQAVELGNQLMSEGLFHHVAKKHHFRDGNFFYQLGSEYRASRPESRASWFGSRRADRSIPSTPLSEAIKASPATEGRRSRSNTTASSQSGVKTPTQREGHKLRFSLSRMMKYDVDPRKKSYRPEIINFHYDRLHNPDNCYHIRIDWMNVTAKLIEDAIATWTVSAEKYGLKLVEVPIDEASTIGDVNPFRSPYVIELAQTPPDVQPSQYVDTNSSIPPVQSEKFPHHKAVLRKLGFVLDLEAASSFPQEADVTYSWGRPCYKFTQYIHTTGLLLAQITDEGKFLLLANRLCNDKAAGSRDLGKFEKTDPDERWNAAGAHGPQSSTGSSDRPSPSASPRVRAVSDHNPATTISSGPNNAHLTAERLAVEVESQCHNVEFLKAVYEEVSRASAVSSPQMTPLVEAPIPVLGLPPPSLGARESLVGSDVRPSSSYSVLSGFDGKNPT